MRPALRRSHGVFLSNPVPIIMNTQKSTSPQNLSTPLIPGWNINEYIDYFGVLDSFKTTLKRLPEPTSRSLKTYQLAMSQMTPLLQVKLTLVLARAILLAYDRHAAGYADWYSLYLVIPEKAKIQDIPLIPAAKNNDAQEIADATLSVLRKEIPIAVREELNAVFKSPEAYERLVTPTVTMLAERLVPSITQAFNTALAAHESIMLAATEKMVNRRLEEVFGPLDASAAPALTPVVVTPVATDKQPGQSPEMVIEGFRVRKPAKKVLRFLVLDLNDDQMSRVRHGISPSVAKIDSSLASSMKFSKLHIYDRIIGCHFTPKEISKTLQELHAERYVFTDGNYAGVRTVILGAISQAKLEAAS